jgi:carbonic anhydrase
MSAIDDLLENARRFAEGFGDGDLPVQPARRLAVVACMDSRIDLFRLLGLRHGEAHVIRNAGGLATDDVLRSLSLSQAILETRDVMVIQHTGCGLHGDEEAIAERIRAVTGAVPGGSLGAFSDVDESVHRSVRRIRESSCLVPGGEVRGFVYHVEDGRLREVA